MTNKKKIRERISEVSKTSGIEYKVLLNHFMDWVTTHKEDFALRSGTILIFIIIGFVLSLFIFFHSKGVYWFPLGLSYLAHKALHMWMDTFLVIYLEEYLS